MPLPPSLPLLSLALPPPLTSLLPLPPSLPPSSLPPSLTHSRVKDCSIEAICNFCLGQEGALSLGSACGHHTSLPATDARYVLQVALSGQDSNRGWQWWLGRLTFMDRFISRFAFEFILSQCVLEPEPATGGGSSDSESDDPSLGSGLVSPSDSITSSVATMSVASDAPYVLESAPSGMESETSVTWEFGNQSHLRGSTAGMVGVEGGVVEELSPTGTSPTQHKVEKNLLMQMWYFAASATHVANSKLSKLARRVIIKIAKILRDDPASLEIGHDVVGRCHRTQAEGLLDRVLQAREVGPHGHHHHQDVMGVGVGGGAVVGERRRVSLEPPRRKTKSPGKGNKLRSPTLSKAGQKDSSPQRSPSVSPVPLSSSSLKNSAEKARKRELVREKIKEARQEAAERAAATTPPSNSGTGKEPTRLRKQKSRGYSTTTVTGGDASDDSYRSALSDLDDLDSTLQAPEEEGVGPKEVGVADEELSSASNSHDSRLSSGSRKLATSHSSGSSIEKGVESGGLVSGFPNKPGYMK